MVPSRGRRITQRSRAIAVTIVLLLALAGCTSAPTSSGASDLQAPARTSSAPTEGHEEARVPGPPGEGDEELEQTQERIEAIQEADEAGVLGRIGDVRRAPAQGWAGERIIHPSHDDWEPAAAADPNAPWVYVLVTRYGAPVCGRCPDAAIMLERSHDGGKDWSRARPICRCRGTDWQADPIIEVAAHTGNVYAVWLDEWNVVFSRSNDHGKTWSDPVSTKGVVAWNDKPTMTVSPNGAHVYVSWNGPTGGDAWVARSIDGGATWNHRKVVDSDRYYFAYTGTVAPGTIAFAESSISYTGPGHAPRGVVKHHVLVSHDRGDTWENVVVDSVRIGEPCIATGCTSDFYIGHSAVTALPDGSLVFLYDGAIKARGRQRIWARSSTDGGQTWSDRVLLSTAGEQAGFPMVVAGSDGVARAWYMQTRDHDVNAWNVWYRSSADGGTTWTPPVRLSDVTRGYPYVTRRGFKEPYGDYGELAVTSTGATFAVWGEGASYLGPGGVWFNRQV